ncbi:YihY/virulence factor BrkB family protein [Nonomuraea sp. SYSU D8015]|uniref:YihY/virulence factor BrkB family protein n=1 Tax=Nonomuraea sp. SYSU D8015 TaxID=2593644 RepID=UPI001660D537|nr:YihY/virulence factor BrkB family protein [Nonomuraea sp. SYSU D8015]
MNLHTWLDTAKTIREEATQERLSLLAAGIAFWATVSAFPLMIGVVVVYGLIADPSQVTRQLTPLTRILPEEVADLLVTQLVAAVGVGRQDLTWGLVASASGLLWASSRAVAALMKGLNAVYGQHSHRGFVARRLVALLVTLASITVVTLTVALVAAVPVVASLVGLQGTSWAVPVVRWVSLVLLSVAALVLLYRFVPERDPSAYRIVGWGVGFALPALLAISVGLSLYVGNFGNYNETYGALAAMIVFMLWLYLASFVVLLGAEVNGAIERQRGQQGPVPPE